MGLQQPFFVIYVTNENCKFSLIALCVKIVHSTQNLNNKETTKGLHSHTHDATRVLSYTRHILQKKKNSSFET